MVFTVGSNVRIICDYKKRVMQVLCNALGPEWHPHWEEVALLQSEEEERQLKMRYGNSELSFAEFLRDHADDDTILGIAYFWYDLRSTTE